MRDEIMSENGDTVVERASALRRCGARGVLAKWIRRWIGAPDRPHIAATRDATHDGLLRRRAEEHKGELHEEKMVGRESEQRITGCEEWHANVRVGASRS
jgi:hypothetical protein